MKFARHILFFISLLLPVLATAQVAGSPRNFTVLENAPPLTATTTSGSVAFTITPNPPMLGRDVYVFNSSPSVDAWWVCGTGSVTAVATPAGGAATSTPIPARGYGIFFKGNANTCAAVTQSGTAVIYFTAGMGN